MNAPIIPKVIIKTGNSYKGFNIEPKSAEYSGNPMRPTVKIMSEAYLSCISGMLQVEGKSGVLWPIKTGVSSPVTSKYLLTKLAYEKFCVKLPTAAANPCVSGDWKNLISVP